MSTTGQAGVVHSPATASTALRTATEAAAAPKWLSVLSHLHPRYGGLSAVVPQLARAVSAAAPLQVEIEAFCLPGENYRGAAYSGVEIGYWPTSRKRWLVESTLRERWGRVVRSADALHIHGLWEQSTLAASAAARRAGKPYIVSAHGMLEPWALRSSRAKKQMYSLLFERGNLEAAACLHALTKAEVRNYRAFGSRRPIAVVPNGVDAPTVLDAEPFLSAFPEARGKRVVLFLGRLHVKKGVDLLLRAWQTLAKHEPEACLVIAGPAEGETQLRLQRLSVELGLRAEQVLYPGMLAPEMKWSALAAAECFVLPSHSEGLSMAALEAMAAGVPVVLSHACNLPEAAAHGAGWSVGLSVDELAEALQLCLRNTPEENRAMGRKGAALVRARYSWPVVAEQMAQLYLWVLGGPAPDLPVHFA